MVPGCSTHSDERFENHAIGAMQSVGRLYRRTSR